MKVPVRDAVAYFRDESVSIGHKLLGAFALLYVISPVDLIPDAIPVIGWLDDIGVVALVVGFYLRQIAKHHERQKAQGMTPKL